MSALRFLIAVLLLSTNGVLAQSPGEIAFWETVRDSKNPAEVQAYLDQYPNGTFAAIAKVRLAALQKPAAAQPSPRPQAAPLAPLTALPPGTRLPQPGDTWTYRLTYPKRFGVPQPVPAVRTHVVKVDSVTDAEIVDQVLVDGASASATRHTRGGQMLTQGVSIFSPYFVVFDSSLSRYNPVGNVTIQETACRSTHACVANARVVGHEQITVAAGTFSAMRIQVEQSWRPGPSATSMGQFQMAQMNGGRTLNIWYAPEVKRAVKITSRHNVGDIVPVETHFDLELTSYQIK